MSDRQNQNAFEMLLATPAINFFELGSDANLLTWIKGERAIFWVWVYVSSATCDLLETTFPKLDLNDRPYEKYALNKNPIDSDERLSLIHDWFQKTENKIGFELTKKIMLKMRMEWLYIKDNITCIDWLRVTEVHTKWLSERLKKDELFHESFLFWFNPENSKERLLAINAAIDFFTPNQTLDVKKFTRFKNEFVKRQKRNYIASTSPEAKKTRQVSVNLAPDAKIMLDKLVKSGGKNQSATIEWLIRDRWATGNQGQNGNEQKEVNARSGED